MTANEQSSTLSAEPTQDAAIHNDPVQHSSRIQRAIELVGQFTTISEFLRVLGAIAIVAALSIFLMMGWEVGNDIKRYFTLLAQTVLLAGGGFTLSYWVKEYKGARIFFGLSLLSVTANFTILGALIYSIVQWDGMLTTYPDFANWILNDVSNVALTVAAAAVVLVPITLFSLAVMSRSNARWLTIGYLVANSALLLPVRGSLASALLSLATIVGIFFLLTRFVEHDDKSKTLEGQFAKAILFLPAVIMVFRSWYFYDVGAMAATVVLFSLYLGLRHLSIKNIGAKASVWLNNLSIPLTVTIPVVFAFAVSEFISDGASLLLIATLTLVFTVDLMRRVNKTYQEVGLSLICSIVTAGCLVTSELVHAGLLLSLGSIFIATVLALYGFIKNHPIMTCVGSVMLASLLLKNTTEFLVWLDFSKWSYLAALGILAIVVGSLLERFGPTIKLKLEAKNRIGRSANR